MKRMDVKLFSEKKGYFQGQELLKSLINSRDDRIWVALLWGDNWARSEAEEHWKWQGSEKPRTMNENTLRGFRPTATRWKRPKRPLKAAWVTNRLHAHAMEYYPALKRKEVLTHTTTWTHREDIMLSERNQSQEDEHCVIPLRWGT